MTTQYLVIWVDFDGLAHQLKPKANVLTVAHPEHEPPKGEALRDLVEEALLVLPEAEHARGYGELVVLHVQELGSAIWAANREYDLLVGGRSAILESGPTGWRVHEAV